VAAFLWAQFGEADRITRERLACWERYHELLLPLEAKGLLRRPVVPSGCQHNAHMYYVLLPRGVNRESVLAHLKSDGISCIFHYVPLHSSPAGKRYARVSGALSITEDLSERLVRLPLWIGLSEEQQTRVARSLERILGQA
jgi:dTDP-4-amino-4,6-dideoxygalactose transaminase